MDKTILKIAVGLLSRREHSDKEIYQKLALRDYSYNEVTPVVEHLIARDYLSNHRFAESVFRTRVNKGYGWRYIKHELSQKGVSSEIITEIAKKSEIDWYLQAELAYNKRFAAIDSDEQQKRPIAIQIVDLHAEQKIKQKSEQKEKAKRIRFLQNRGFSTDEIMTVINN